MNVNVKMSRIIVRVAKSFVAGLKLDESYNIVEIPVNQSHIILHMVNIVTNNLMSNGTEMSLMDCLALSCETAKILIY
jgi:hypothetical protein